MSTSFTKNVTFFAGSHHISSETKSEVYLSGILRFDREVKAIYSLEEVVAQTEMTFTYIH